MLYRHKTDNSQQPASPKKCGKIWFIFKFCQVLRLMIVCGRQKVRIILCTQTHTYATRQKERCVWDLNKRQCRFAQKQGNHNQMHFHRGKITTFWVSWRPRGRKNVNGVVKFHTFKVLHFQLITFYYLQLCLSFSRFVFVFSTNDIFGFYCN